MNGFTVPQIFLNLIIAAKWTIILSLIAFVVGGIVGFLLMLMRIYPNKWIRGLSLIYIEFFQGTPERFADDAHSSHECH